MFIHPKKSLNEKISKNAVLSNSQVWTNAKKFINKEWPNAKEQNATETKYITIKYKYDNIQKAIYKFIQSGHS